MNAASSPAVAISLVNTNSREYLRQCLTSLPDACQDLDWAVTVVDNASTDGSTAMVAADFPNVVIVSNRHPLGFSANHNQVIRRALASNTRFVLVLNEDTVLGEDSIRMLVRFCETNEKIGAAGPRIVGSDGQPQRSLFPFPTMFREAFAALMPGRPRTLSPSEGWLNGSCILLRTEALRDVGVLDERFFLFFEDTDIGYRLHEAGWISEVCPTAQIVHHGHQVVSQPEYGDRMEQQVIRSRYLYFRKHHGRTRAQASTTSERLRIRAQSRKSTYRKRRHAR